MCISIYAHVTVAFSAESSSGVTPSHEVQTKDNDILLLINVASDDAEQRAEQQFLLELALVLEDFTVREISPGSDGADNFAHVSLGEQIGTVRPLIETHNAVAAVWLEHVSSELLVLHMVAVSSGRALARLVEVTPSEGFEADLALAARELLGTAFSFHDSTKQEAPSKTTHSTVEPPTENASSSQRTEPSWHVFTYGKGEGGLVGHEGPTVQLGGAIGIDRRIGRDVWGRAYLGAKGGYPDSGEEKGLSTFGFEPGIGVFYMWDWEHVSLAPVLEMQLVWMRLKAERINSDSQSFSVLAFRLSTFNFQRCLNCVSVFLGLQNYLLPGESMLLHSGSATNSLLPMKPS